MKVDTSILGRVALGGINMRGLCIHSVSSIFGVRSEVLFLVAVIWPATAQRMYRWRAKINNNTNDRLTPRIRFSHRFTIVCGRYLLAALAVVVVVEEKAEKCFLFAHRTMCYLFRLLAIFTHKSKRCCCISCASVSCMLYNNTNRNKKRIECNKSKMK